MTRLPKAQHSRSRLLCHLNEYDEGARSLFVSAHTYPEVFDVLCSDVVRQSPKGWRLSKGGKMQYLWFPAGALEEADVEQIQDWKEHFETYVLLGSNSHLDGHFTDELDYCMALDYNYLPAEEKRTFIGEAEYQLKYQGSLAQFGALRSALVEALAYLPLDDASRESMAITWVPALAAKDSVPRRLAQAIAEVTGHELVAADLLAEKGSLKGLPVAQKIPEWKRIYSEPGSVALRGNVSGRVVVVVDDLYQSGATLWSFAAYLKQQGAEAVVGLPCVKSLRDSDNQ